MYFPPQHTLHQLRLQQLHCSFSAREVLACPPLTPAFRSRKRKSGSDEEGDAETGEAKASKKRPVLEPVRRSSRAAALEKKSYTFDSDDNKSDEDDRTETDGPSMPALQVSGIDFGCLYSYFFLACVGCCTGYVV